MPITTEEDSIFQLLRYPYLWSPQKIINFLVKVQDTLQHWVDGNPQALKSLNSEAQKSGVLEYRDEYGCCNWGKGFTEKQLDALTTFYNRRKQKVPERNMTYRFDLVTDLVKAFRHRHVHHRELPQAERECLLGMLPVERYESLFDMTYVSMWTTKFPRLLLFLWLQFQVHTNESWNSYYPVDLNLDFETAPQDLQGYLEKFNASFISIKSFGHLKFRFTANNKIVEFYQLSPDYAHGLFSSGAASSILHIYQDRITYYWTKGKYLEYYNNVTGNSNNCDLTNSSVAICDKLSLSELEGSISYCPNKRIIFIVTGVNNINAVVPRLKCNIQEMPLALNELDNETIQRVINTSVVIGKKEKLAKIDRLMSLSDTNSILKGDELNVLLSGKTLHIFPSLALPEVEFYFLKRHVEALNDKHDNSFLMEATQKEFLKYVLINQSPHQMIFLSGKCGMGKSMFMRKLARKINSGYCYKFTLIYSMCEFLEMLPERCTVENVTINDIVKCISNHVCQTDFEKDLISLWFRERLDCRIRLEVFFDSLDEIAEEYQNLSYRILELLRENCPNLRLWINSRDYLAADIQTRFNIPAYCLVSLNDLESASLITRYCISVYKKMYELEPAPETVIKYKEYAKVCIRRLFVENSDLLDVPLHCKMIADLIMSAASNENERYIIRFFEQLNSSKVLIYIYKHLIEGKCDFYLNKYQISQPRASSIRHHSRDLHMNSMARAATILAIELLFGRQVRQNFERLITPDQICSKVVLDQGIVQNVDDLEFCNNSFAEFIVADFVYNVLHTDNYLGIQKHDIHFQELLWDKILIVKLESHPKGERLIFTHTHLFTMFIWLCNQWLEIIPENCREIAWFRKYVEWTKNSESCLEQYKKFCNSDPHKIVQTNDLAVLLDPNIFMIFALSLGFKNSAIELLDPTNPYKNAFLNRQRLLRAIKSHQMTESQADSYITEVTEDGD